MARALVFSLGARGDVWAAVSDEGQSLSIRLGRGNECELALPDGVEDVWTVSRTHARFFKLGIDYWVEDLGSKHLTYVDGQVVLSPTKVTVPCEVRLGNVSIRVERKELSQEDFERCYVAFPVSEGLPATRGLDQLGLLDDKSQKILAQVREKLRWAPAVQHVSEALSEKWIALTRLRFCSTLRTMYSRAQQAKSLTPLGNQHFDKLTCAHSHLHMINKYKLDEIVVTDVDALGSNLMAFVDECHKRDVFVKLAPDFSGVLQQQRTLGGLAGPPVVQINEIAIVRLARALKRIEDMIVSAGLLALTWWIFLITAIAIKLESRGPVLFRQERAGKNGAIFTLYKFRSMVYDAEQHRRDLDVFNESDGFLFKMKEDPRITRVGRIIRKTSIDELPQLLNVVRGDMSLVGPRPLPAVDIKKTNGGDHHRLSVRPGITGLWQVNRKEHTSKEMTKWDMYYIENWSLWLDLRILFKTVSVVLFGKGAY